MSKPPIRYEFVTEVPPEDIVNLYIAGDWWKENEHNRAIIPGMIRGSFCFMVAFHNDLPIAMGRVISDGYSDGYIQDLVVKAEYRGQGIGKELVRRLAAYCKSKQLDWIGLIAERNTQGFYEDLGFHAIDGDQLMVLKD